MKRSPQGARAKQQRLIELGSPDIHFIERSLRSQGYQHIAGVDEAGRGPLAGPVVAAAVVLPADFDVEGVRDSKQLSEEVRERLFDVIREKSVSHAVGVVRHDEIDRINILQATLKAMKDAVTGLGVEPDFLIVDGINCVDMRIRQRALKKGDSRSVTIAAASILAKVTRDRMMREYEKEYPQFSFSVHKGYGTALHLDELRRHGPTPIHRMTFKGVS